MKHRLLVAIAVALGIPAMTMPASAQISASPAMVWFDAAEAAGSSSVLVRNEGQQPRQVRVYTSDFEQSASGENHFEPSGTLPGSCGERLSVTPDIAVLAPGESRNLRVELSDAAEPCWAVVFIQTSDLHPASGITVAQRVGVKVFAGSSAAGGLDGEITTVEVDPTADGLAVSFDFRNGSTTALRPFGSVELRTLAGEAVADAAIEPFSVLPGRTRRIQALVPASLPAGRYVAVPVVDFGGEYLAGGQATLRVD